MSDANGFTGVRLKMIEDLLNRYDFHDWSADQVQELLGPAPFDDQEGNTRHLRYDLRDGLKFLVFELNDRARVARYFVRMDD